MKFPYVEIAPKTVFVVNDVVNPFSRLGNCYIIIVERENNSNVARVKNYLEHYRIIGTNGRIWPVKNTNYLPTFYLHDFNKTAEIYRHYREIKPYPKNHNWHAIEANIREGRAGRYSISTSGKDYSDRDVRYRYY